MNRFEAFEENTLSQDLTKPVTGQDIIRFLDFSIGKIVREGKTAVSEGLVISANEVLVAYGAFTYPSSTRYKLDAHDTILISTWRDDAKRKADCTLANGTIQSF